MSQKADLFSSQLHKLTAAVIGVKKILSIQRQNIFHDVVEKGDKIEKILRQLKMYFENSISPCEKIVKNQFSDSNLSEESSKKKSRAPVHLVVDGHTIVRKRLQDQSVSESPENISPDEERLIGNRIQELGIRIVLMEKSLKVCHEVLQEVTENSEKALEAMSELRNHFNDSITSCRDALVCQSITFAGQIDITSQQKILSQLVENFEKALDLMKQLKPCMKTTIESCERNSKCDFASSSFGPSQRVHPNQINPSIVEELQRYSNQVVPDMEIFLNKYNREILPRIVGDFKKAMEFLKELENVVKNTVASCEEILKTQHEQEPPTSLNNTSVTNEPNAQVASCSHKTNSVQNMNEKNQEADSEDDIEEIYSSIMTEKTKHPKERKCSLNGENKQSRKRCHVKRGEDSEEDSDDTESSDSDSLDYRHQKMRYEYVEERDMINCIREKRGYKHANSVTFWRKMKDAGLFPSRSEDSLARKWKESTSHRLEYLIFDDDERKKFQNALSGARKKKKEKHCSFFRHTR